MRISRWFRISIFMVVAGQAQAQAQLPRMELSVGFHRVVAEVAFTDPMRQLGLMNRQAMASHHGMLFVFPNAATHCMWMRNTHIPLSVAFLDDRGQIINLADMKPRSDESHCASSPARFALEMNQGWFAKRGIKAGARIAGVDKAPPPR